MEFTYTTGKKVAISFWTHDQKLLLDIRKLLMNNMIKFNWREKQEQGVVRGRVS